MSDLNSWIFPFLMILYFSRLDWFKRYGVLKLGTPLIFSKIS